MDIKPIEFEEEPQQPENIRFKNVALNLYPDRRRVKVGMQLTPFISPPNIEIEVRDTSEDCVANASIIGASSANLEITLHLRGNRSDSEFRFLMTLGYQDIENVDQREVILRMPESDHGLEDPLKR